MGKIIKWLISLANFSFGYLKGVCFKYGLYFFLYFLALCSSEVAQLVPLPFSRGGLLVILIDCMIFTSPSLDVTRMSMSTVSFLAQLDSGILYL